jgi:hypothetical protein
VNGSLDTMTRRKLPALTRSTERRAPIDPRHAYDSVQHDRGGLVNARCRFGRHFNGAIGQ